MKDCRAAAFHEAGHAVVGWALHYQVQSVRIEGASGRAHSLRPAHLVATDIKACEAEAIIHRAGKVAERMHCGASADTGTAGFIDLEAIRKLAMVIDPTGVCRVYRRLL